MKTEYYPTLVLESDMLAVRAQGRHFLFTRAKIGFLVAISAIMAVPWDQTYRLRTPIAAILAVALVISMAFTAIVNTKRFDQAWLNFRAVTESLKSEAWLFMMKVEPYGGGITDLHAEDRFLKRMGEILHRRPSVCAQLALDLKEDAQITNQMRELREKGLADRLDFYVQNRIQDQRLWFAEKAKWNKKREAFWFVITWLIELSATLIAIAVIILPDMGINPVGIVTTAGAGILAWRNARSYSEPAESYGIVSQELVLLHDRVNRVSTEKDLTRIVLGGEHAIERENTIWLGSL